MFCAKCGKQIPDGSAVCPFCGAPMAAPQAPQAAPVAPQAAPVAPQAPFAAVPPVAPVYAPVAPKEKKPVNKLPIIIGAIAAVAVIAVVLFLILHDGAKAVVKDYLNYQEDAEKQEGKFLVKSSEKALKALDLWDDDDDEDGEVTWSIKDSKSYSGKDDPFEGLCTYIEKNMKGETKKVSKMSIVEVKIKSGSGKDKDSRSMFFTCVKISGNWYILDYTTSGENIKDVANKWEKYTSSSKNNDDDDD